MLWRRDRLPTPVFLGFPCGSTGKESACNVRSLGLIPALGRSPGEGKGYLLTQVFRTGESQGLYSPWGRKESDTTDPTERLSLSLVVQCLRILLAMQGMKGPSLVQEDPTHLGRTKPTTTESMHRNERAT